MGCPRTERWEQSLGKSSKDKSAPSLWVIALFSLTTGVLWSWRGDIKRGKLADRLWRRSLAVLQRALGVRRGFRGLRLVLSLL